MSRIGLFIGGGQRGLAAHRRFIGMICGVDPAVRLGWLLFLSVGCWAGACVVLGFCSLTSESEKEKRGRRFVLADPL